MNKYQEEFNLTKRLYRRAKQLGLKLQVCRRGKESGTYRILDRQTGMVLYAARPDGYGLSLALVEERLKTAPERLNFEQEEKSISGSSSASPSVNAKAIPSAGNNPAKQPLNRALLDEKYVASSAGADAQEALRRAGVVILVHITHIFELMRLWAMSQIEGSPARPPTPAELEVMGHYLETWKLVAECSADQLRLFLFAHLLDATKSKSVLGQVEVALATAHKIKTTRTTD